MTVSIKYPARPGTPGGGNGGAICNDGNNRTGHVVIRN
jgi:hypothetical protein